LIKERRKNDDKLITKSRIDSLRGLKTEKNEDENEMDEINNGIVI
jgi:hypothetical protein